MFVQVKTRNSVSQQYHGTFVFYFILESSISGSAKLPPAIDAARRAGKAEARVDSVTLTERIAGLIASRRVASWRRPSAHLTDRRTRAAAARSPPQAT